MIDTTHTSAATLAHPLRAARLKVAFEGQPSSLLLSSLLATLTLAVLWPTGERFALLLWYGVFIAITLARIWLFRSHRSLVDGDDAGALARLQAHFVFSCCAAGASWGLACVTIFPHDPLLKMFLSFSLAGVSAAAVTSLSALRSAALGFVLLAAGPLALRLLTAGTDIDVAMGLMVLMFLLVVGVSVTRLDAQLLALVRARMESDEHLRAREQQQMQVQALNERLRLAIRASKAGIFEWDVVANTIGGDERIRELYDLRHDKPFTYEVWRQRVHPHDLAKLETSLTKALRGDTDEFNEEFRVIWSDGTERFVKSSAIVQRDAGGQPLRVVGLNSDITELRRVDRMKGEFVSIVSHELRTPLTSIRAALGLIAAGGVGAIAPKAQQLLQLANRNAERLNVLIDDILDMDKIESGKLRFDLAPQPLLPIVEQALSMNAVYATSHKVALRFVAPPRDMIVAVDANRLLQVMTNLLSNAIKFSRPNSPVDIVVAENGSRVTIEVRDHGAGIPADFQPKVFTKFSQGDASDTRSKGGSGLGLAISKALIERMTGTISFRTAAEEGTSFFIELPLRTPGSPVDDAERTTVVLPMSLA